MKRSLALLAAVSICAVAPAQGYIDYFLAGEQNNAVREFISTDRTFVQMFIQPTNGMIETPQAMVHGGPTKDFFIADGTRQAILQFDGLTGRYERSLGEGTIGNCFGLAFGTDGKLYASSMTNATVLRFNTSTGVLDSTFVTTGNGGLIAPKGIVFRPNGNLYVADVTGNVVREFDASGAFVRNIGSGLLNAPSDVAMTPNGKLLVLNQGANAVDRFEPFNGNYMSRFTNPGNGGLGVPTTFEMSPDGKLFIVDQGNSKVLRYNGTTGAFIDVFMSGALGSPFVGCFAPGIRKVAGISINQDGVAGGHPVVVSVYLNGEAVPGGCNVIMSSSNTNVATIPSLAKVLQGQRSVSVYAQTKGQLQDTSVTFTATRSGSLSTSLDVLRGIVNDLTVAPTAVSGGTSATGTVGFSGAAPSGGANVLLSSNMTGVATVPSMTTIAAGAFSKTFTVTTFAVASTQVVTLTASRSGFTATTTLTVNP